MEDKNKSTSNEKSSQIFIITPEELAKLGILGSLSKTDNKETKFGPSTSSASLNRFHNKNFENVLKHSLAKKKITSDEVFKQPLEFEKTNEIKDDKSNKKIPETTTRGVKTSKIFGKVRKNHKDTPKVTDIDKPTKPSKVKILNNTSVKLDQEILNKMLVFTSQSNSNETTNVPQMLKPKPKQLADIKINTKPSKAHPRKNTSTKDSTFKIEVNNPNIILVEEKKNDQTFVNTSYDSNNLQTILINETEENVINTEENISEIQEVNKDNDRAKIDRNGSGKILVLENIKIPTDIHKITNLKSSVSNASIDSKSNTHSCNNSFPNEDFMEIEASDVAMEEEDTVTINHSKNYNSSIRHEIETSIEESDSINIVVSNAINTKGSSEYSGSIIINKEDDAQISKDGTFNNTDEASNDIQTKNDIDTCIDAEEIFENTNNILIEEEEIETNKSKMVCETLNNELDVDNTIIGDTEPFIGLKEDDNKNIEIKDDLNVVKAATNEMKNVGRPKRKRSQSKRYSTDEWLINDGGEVDLGQIKSFGSATEVFTDPKKTNICNRVRESFIDNPDKINNTVVLGQQTDNSHVDFVKFVKRKKGRPKKRVTQEYFDVNEQNNISFSPINHIHTNFENKLETDSIKEEIKVISCVSNVDNVDQCFLETREHISKNTIASDALEKQTITWESPIVIECILPCEGNESIQNTISGETSETAKTENAEYTILNPMEESFENSFEQNSSSSNKMEISQLKHKQTRATDDSNINELQIINIQDVENKDLNVVNEKPEVSINTVLINDEDTSVCSIPFENQTQTDYSQHNQEECNSKECGDITLSDKAFDNDSDNIQGQNKIQQTNKSAIGVCLKEDVEQTKIHSHETIPKKRFSRIRTPWRNNKVTIYQRQEIIKSEEKNVDFKEKDIHFDEKNIGNQKTDQDLSNLSYSEETNQIVKRKRGRPRKSIPNQTDTSTNDITIEEINSEKIYNPDTIDHIKSEVDSAETNQEDNNLLSTPQSLTITDSIKSSNELEAVLENSSLELPLKKKRGRKPKIKTAEYTPSPELDIEIPMGSSRRGRRYVKINYLDLENNADFEENEGKNHNKSTDTTKTHSFTEENTHLSNSDDPPKKKRGRKPKIRVPDLDENKGVEGNVEPLDSVGELLEETLEQHNSSVDLPDDTPKNKRGRKPKIRVSDLDENTAVEGNVEPLESIGELLEETLDQNNSSVDLPDDTPKNKIGRKPNIRVSDLNENTAVEGNVEPLDSVGELLEESLDQNNSSVDLPDDTPKNKIGRKPKIRVSDLNENTGVEGNVEPLDSVGELLEETLDQNNSSVDLPDDPPKNKRGRKPKIRVSDLGENIGVEGNVEPLDSVGELLEETLDQNNSSVDLPDDPPKNKIGRKPKIRVSDLNENTGVEGNVEPLDSVGELLEETLDQNNSSADLPDDPPKNKRGRKPKIRVSDLGENIGVEGNVEPLDSVGELLEETLDQNNSSLDLHDGTPKKKRGRKPKIRLSHLDENIRVEGNVEPLDSVGELLEETLDQNNSSSTNLLQGTPKKKRGRKPKGWVPLPIESGEHILDKSDLLLDIQNEKDTIENKYSNEVPLDNIEEDSSRKIFQLKSEQSELLEEKIDESLLEQHDTKSRCYLQQNDNEMDSSNSLPIKKRGRKRKNDQCIAQLEEQLLNEKTKQENNNLDEKGCTGNKRKRSISDNEEFEPSTEKTNSEKSEEMLDLGESLKHKAETKCKRGRSKKEIFAIDDEGKVTCGICQAKLENDDWDNHNEDKHYFLSWREGEPSVALDTPHLIKKKLNPVLSKRNN